MTIGERIKKIRVFRKMTMDDLGGALGFEGKNMSVRISQYETGARIPGEDMILKLADALHCNYKAISDYSLGAAEDYDCAGAPVALTFEYGLVNDFLSEWCEMKTKLNNGEISPNEYFEWKITWPHAMN